MKGAIERKTNWISFVLNHVAFMGLWGAEMKNWKNTHRNEPWSRACIRNDRLIWE